MHIPKHTWQAGVGLAATLAALTLGTPGTGAAAASHPVRGGTVVGQVAPGYLADSIASDGTDSSIASDGTDSIASDGTNVVASGGFHTTVSVHYNSIASD